MMIMISLFLIRIFSMPMHHASALSYECQCVRYFTPEITHTHTHTHTHMCVCIRVRRTCAIHSDI